VRNHDVLAKGYTADGQALVGVEGKVNESLGARIKGQYSLAEKAKAQSRNTNLDKRSNALLVAIVGTAVAHDLQVNDLRYQLFTALAGTVAAATADTAAPKRGQRPSTIPRERVTDHASQPYRR
jgi:uncharacterized membrane protein